ncbi:MAG: methylmalonyl-CoA mutase family protein [Acidobacteriota bacterium]|nr:MAG: methylmalonyl-CoA mutase family protein [Acidobacteriota bacterium]
MDERDTIRREKQRWERELVEPHAGRVPERAALRTSSGIDVHRLYTPLDRAERGYLEQLGFPGEHPFTRGVQPTMYRSRLWTMRQYAGFGTAEQSNARYRYLLERGQTGLSIAFDLPTQMGYDADDPLAEGEVGKVGVAIDSLADMEILLDGIPLDRVSTSMTINAPASILLALYVAVARKQGIPPDKLRGTIQNDVLKEYIARGTYIFPPRPSLRIVTDIFAWCAEQMPRWNTISISGYHIREAGSTAVQEIAFTLANGIAYVEAALAAGLDLEQFAPRLSFFFNAQLHLLEEAAKFRAARRLWARIIRERFGAKNPACGRLRFHAQTAGASLTAQQPENNIVRTAYEALAAVLGGCQSLHTNSMDEALGLPTEKAVTLALRTQQVLAHETWITDSIDQLAGSFFVEALTDELEARSSELLGKIDTLGGAVAAIEQGYQQREIADAAYQFQRKIESGEQIIVGVNEFTTDSETEMPVHQVADELRQRQADRTRRVRESRDARACASALETVEQRARSDHNLMPAIVEAVSCYATVGEITERLARVFGRYQEAMF